jgi:branched-chain amino acid transport system ATP-binding protein
MTPRYWRLILARNNNVLKIENLSVSYGYIAAIRRVSLEVNQDELVGLIGANGAGKSTLIRTLLGVARAKSGTIWFMGQDITQKSTDSIVASGISVVPEGRGILPLMTVMENLQLGAYHFKGDINERFDWVFDRFPVLAGRKNQQAGTLSGGEQQMLAIGRALMGSPKLIVMDEPSLGLAPLLVSKVFDIIAALRDEGQAMLIAEQNVRKALQCADRAYVFEVGRIVLEGTAQELASNPRVRQAYLGDTA